MSERRGEGLAERLRRLAGEIEAALLRARAEAWGASATAYDRAMEAEEIRKDQGERMHAAVRRRERRRQ